MATIRTSGPSGVSGFRMGSSTAGDILVVPLAANGVISNGGQTVSFTQGTSVVVLRGSFGSFDASGRPQSGVISSIEYSYSSGASVMTVSDLSLSASDFTAWVSQINGAAFQAALFGGPDAVTGSAADETLWGFGGNDVLSGGAGNDRLEGGAGSNTLNGGDGNDTLVSVGASDVIDGGAGTDFVMLYRADSTLDFTLDMAKMATSAGVVLADGTSVRNTEECLFAGGSGNDTIILNTIPGANTVFYGGGGLDTIVADFSSSSFDIGLSPGGPGAQATLAFLTRPSSVFVGVDGFERFLISTGSGVDGLRGGTGNDVFKTGAGNDLA